MANGNDTLGVKVGTMLATFAAGWVVQKVIGAIWQKATGNAAPIDLDDDDVTVVQAVTFAAVSGGLAIFARKLARNGTRAAAAHFAAKAAAAQTSTENQDEALLDV
ncbi:MAG: DUF4235 domain-containing protein [Promicromonosporaceae bacterium]|nr:DUF4235 domain-containing protein [Promicromonosporaceae bacterium]